MKWPTRFEKILCGRYTHITCSAVGQHDESMDNQVDHAGIRLERMSKTSVTIGIDSPTQFAYSIRLLDSVKALYGRCICPICNTIDQHDVNMGNQHVTYGTGSRSSRGSGGGWSTNGGQSSGSSRHSFEQSAIAAQSTCITSACALSTMPLLQDLTLIVVVEDTRRTRDTRSREAQLLCNRAIWRTTFFLCD